MKYLLLTLLLFISCQRNYESYFWYYQVETRSDYVEATYRMQDGSYKTQRVFNGWIYGWGTSSSTHRYYIKLVNKSQFGGYMLARVIRDRDTIDIAVSDTVTKLPR